VNSRQKPIRPVAVYTRVSEQGQRSDEELHSHDLQRMKIEGYLAAHDMVPAAEKFEDTDVSGRKMSRPAFDRAIAGIRSGTYGGIGVARLSRFGRKTSGILELIYELEELGGAVIVLDPPIDTSTAAGRAMLTVFSAFVTMEAEQAQEQAALVAEKKIAEGKGMGGWAALGYEFESLGKDSNGRNLRGWLVLSADAEHVEAAFRLFVNGGTPGKVADFLNGLGLRTGRGRPWGIESVRKLLMNEVYLGVRKYGDVRIEAAHEAIVPMPLFRKAVTKLGYTYTPGKGLARLGGPVTRTRGEGHVLGEGLVRCGLCGGALVKGSANGKYGTLRCLTRGPGHPSIIYARAQEFIVSEVIRHIGWTMQHSGGNAEEFKAAQARLALAREGLADVEASEFDSDWTPLAYGKALAKAQREVEAAEEALARLDPTESTIRFLTPLGTRRAFDELSIPEQRQVLHGMIERVVLAKTKGSAEDRLRIEFKDGSYVGGAEWKAERDARWAEEGTRILKMAASRGSPATRSRS
jgi:DNA invertase Pin-like site-specific DNA recombinase